MLPCAPRRLVVAMHQVDFRKQFNGLLAEARKLGFDPYNGDCVIFIKRDKRQLRALMGDAAGLFMISRRFDGGPLQFKWMVSDTPKPESISMAQLTLLLEGASWEVHKRVAAWRQ